MIVRDGRKGLGRLTLHRAVGERPFSLEEERRVAALGPFIAHAIKGGSESEVELVDSGRSGLIVANAEGKTVYFSAEGKRLLFRAMHDSVRLDTVFDRLTVLPPPIAQLCQNLDRIFSDDPSPSAPVYHHRNVWGGFTFRAHWLQGNDAVSGMIGINVSHQEPLPIKLMRRVEKLRFNHRRAQVCCLLASGASNEKIAGRLGISKHTAIAHGRWIYDKLEVHNRAELVNKLLLVPA